MHNNEDDTHILKQDTFRRIMVVDDEPDVTLSLKEVIEENGVGIDNIRFLVDTFNDPMAALDTFKRIPPGSSYDLLLLDIRMPNMSGFALYEEIVRIAHEDIKVCFITGFESYYESLKEDFPGLTNNCFIKKPIKTDDLRKKIIGLIKSKDSK